MKNVKREKQQKSETRNEKAIFQSPTNMPKEKRKKI